jgi:uncharacterized membrane protein YkoI
MRLTRLFAVICALAAAGPMPAAGWPYPPGQQLVLAQAAATIGEDRAASIARNATGGRVLNIRWKEAGGRPLYEVKVLLADGRVTIVRVDAQSGSMR